MMLVRRWVAYSLDALVGFALFAGLQMALFVPLRTKLGISEPWFYSGWNTQLYTWLTASLPVWLYFSLTQASAAQATWGMRTLGLRLHNLRSNLPVSLNQAFIRSLVLLLPWELAHIANNFPIPLWYDPQPGFRPAFALVVLLGGLTIALILFRSDQRGLPDLVAGTQLIQRKNA
ncbi:MAG: RDD family protein [Anaerolineales bacterium]|nr:RDD family protein [Anaerolineales bacterium]